MLQKPENISQEEFLKDVQTLGLRFPVAAIAKETGTSKSNVSRYLSGELMPSVNFLKLFYEKFPKSNNNVSYPMQQETELINSLREQIAQLKEINGLLKDQMRLSLTEAINNQVLIQAQLRALSELVAECFAGTDKKAAELNRIKLSRYVSEFAREGLKVNIP